MGLDFTGQVAIVTGAGGGLGRVHALGLAARGAKVLVNDLGGAQAVVDEIVAAGGQALANGASVVDASAVQALLTRMSTWPQVPSAWSTIACTADASATDAPLASAWPPAAAISSTTA